MIKLTRIIKDWQECGALHALVPIHAAVDDSIFLLKTGHLMMLVGIDGIDYECLDTRELEQITRRFEGALRILGEEFRLYQYQLKRDNVAIAARTYDNNVVQEAVQNRIAYLKTKATQLYSFETYLVLVFEGWQKRGKLKPRLQEFFRSPIDSLKAMLLSNETSNHLETDMRRACGAMEQKVRSFLAQLPDSLHAKVLERQRVFTFVRKLLNYAPYKQETVGLKYDDHIDFQACDSTLECYRDHLRIDEDYVQVLTLKEAPAQTFANLFRHLQEVPCNFIVETEWKAASPAVVRKVIQSKRRHFYSLKSSLVSYLTSNRQTGPTDTLIDDSAVAIVGELGQCLEEIAVKGRLFGLFSMTVILYNSDRLALQQSVAEIFKVFGAQDAQVLNETYNQLNAWLAVLPGNSAFNLRSMWLLSSNYADLSFLFTQRTGETVNPHLGAEYLAVLETNHGAPYFLNLHYQDLAHTLVLGASGSGKSFLLTFLLTHAQKYNPFTFVFDLGGSYENLTRRFGGTYLPVGVGHSSFHINPFALPRTAENLHFLFAFLKVLIESDDFRMSAQEERDVYEQIDNIYIVEPSQRRLLTLTNMLGRRLRVQLQKWVEGGPYAALFDNTEDTLSFARFQTFDFEGMEKLRDALEALLFYVLYRTNVAINALDQTSTFKIFVCDEAWRFFRHPTIKLYIIEALKTWRKKNGGMILATQSGDDLLRSEMLPVVVESCATKIFLANPDIDLATYREAFHLNETESEWITKLIPKRQMLIKRPDMAKVVNLNVDAKDYWLYTSNPYDRERRRQAFEQFGFKEGLEILSKES